MKPTRRIINMACVDDQDPNKLPIVSGKERGGKTTLITAVLIDGDKGWFDEAATHGRTPLEQGIAWKSSPEEVPNGRQIDIVWLFIKPDQGDYVYYGATASSMIIDEEAKVGYKYLRTTPTSSAKPSRAASTSPGFRSGPRRSSAACSTPIPTCWSARRRRSRPPCSSGGRRLRPPRPLPAPFDKPLASWHTSK